MIVQQIKLIGKTLSGELTGTNINIADDTHIHNLARATSNAIQTADANPLRSDSYSSTLLPRKIPKELALGISFGFPVANP